MQGEPAMQDHYSYVRAIIHNATLPSQQAAFCGDTRSLLRKTAICHCLRHLIRALKERTVSGTSVNHFLMRSTMHQPDSKIESTRLCELL